jgi:hypothetical protein
MIGPRRWASGFRLRLSAGSKLFPADAWVVASICPKVLEDPATGEAMSPANPNYGYNPALSALIGRFKERLAGE